MNWIIGYSGWVIVKHEVGNLYPAFQKQVNWPITIKRQQWLWMFCECELVSSDISLCIGDFSHYCDKVPHKRSLRKEWFPFSHSFEVPLFHSGEDTVVSIALGEVAGIWSDWSCFTICLIWDSRIWHGTTCIHCCSSFLSWTFLETDL